MPDIQSGSIPDLPGSRNMRMKLFFTSFSGHGMCYSGPSSFLSNLLPMLVHELWYEPLPQGLLNSSQGLPVASDQSLQRFSLEERTKPVEERLSTPSILDAMVSTHSSCPMPPSPRADSSKQGVVQAHTALTGSANWGLHCPERG